MNSLPGFSIPLDEGAFQPTKIVSGGQTGVDRGALDAAMALAIPHGGYCPAGRLAEDGRIPNRYQLCELNSRHYPDRTERNIVESDATLILYVGRLRGGTALTKRLCDQHQKPYLSVRLTIPVGSEPIERISVWLSDIRPLTLNVAGPRESNVPGIADETCRILTQIWQPS